MTKVTIELPAEAARKLLENPEAAMEYLRQQGMDCVAIEPTRIQVYAWEHPNGTTVRWNITRAIELTNARSTPDPLDHRIGLADILAVISRNEYVQDLDKAFAMTRDLSLPIIGTRTPVVEPGEYQPNQLPIIIIDGWHRMLRAALTEHPSLPVRILTPQEDAECRINETPKERN